MPRTSLTSGALANDRAIVKRARHSTDDPMMRCRAFAFILMLMLMAAIAPAAPAAAADTNVFENAIGVLREESSLLPQAGPANSSASNYAQIRTQLQTVDGMGDDLLQQLVAAGISPSSTLTRTLGRLPVPGSPGSIPAPRDYATAIGELRTLAAGPRTVGATPSASAGLSRGGIIALGAGVLAALGGVAGLAMWLRRRRDAELLTIAMTDALTELCNRRKLDLDIESLRQGAPVDVAVLMIDVDHFKQINDLNGHGVGDEVLRRVASELRAQMRPDDRLYRYGGEEFCALLPRTRLLDAGVVGERVRHGLSIARMPIDGGVTVSVGVGAGSSPQMIELVAHADVALLDAKRTGRNRVEVWNFAAAPAGSRPSGPFVGG